MNGSLPPAWSLLPLIAIVLLRRALGGQPFFPGEFVVEDLILLVILASAVAPVRWQALLWRVTTVSVNITIAIVAFTIRAHPFPLALCVLLAAHNLALLVIELSKYRRTSR